MIATIKFDNHDIQILKPSESVKYLGMLISPSKSLRNNRKNFLQSSSFVIRELSKSQWKGKIKHQINDWVILGKFEYFLLSYFLDKTSLYSLQVKISRMIKSVYKISSKTSNKILVGKGTINLTPLEERQKLSTINNLAAKLASPSLQKYMVQEIKSIQQNEAIWYCPICNPSKFKQDNWILYAASAAKEFQIQLCQQNCNFTDDNASNSIGFYLNSIPKPTKKTAIATVNALNIRFTNQLLRFNSTIKLQWYQLASHTGKVRCGPEPNWFKNFINPENLIGTSGPIPNPIPLFWMIKGNHCIVKTHKRPRSTCNNRIMKGSHYTIDQQNLLHKCNGCLEGTKIENACLISFTSREAISLWSSQVINSHTKYKLNNSLEEIIELDSVETLPISSIEISYHSESSSLRDIIGVFNIYHIQPIADSVIINNRVIKIGNNSTQRGNALLVIQDIIKWCPNNITINIHSNQKIIRTQVDNPRRAIKTDFAAILSEISRVKAQKMITFIESKPKKISRSEQANERLVWFNTPTFHSTSLLINNLNLGSINRWCKKIFSIIKTYIICESSSFFSTFNRAID